MGSILIRIERGRAKRDRGSTTDVPLGRVVAIPPTDSRLGARISVGRFPPTDPFVLSRGGSDRSIWFRSNIDIAPLYAANSGSPNFSLRASMSPPAEDDLPNGSICYGLSYAREEDRSR